METLSINYDVYQNIRNIAILENKIAEVDIYTCNMPIVDASCNDVCFAAPVEQPQYITSQLLYIISLEKELSLELMKLSAGDRNNVTDKSRQQKSFKDNNIILDLERRISCWDREIEARKNLFENCCFNYFAGYSSITNGLLIKRILCMRLERELKKKGNSRYSYGAIAGPLFETPPSNYQNGAVVDALKRKIAKLESDPSIKRRFETLGAKAFVFSIYNAAQIHDLRNQLRQELAKPKLGDNEI